MQSKASNNAHLRAVEIPHFITTAKEMEEARERAKEEQERALHRMLIQAYRLEVIRIILDVCVIGVFVLLLCAYK